MPLIGEVDAAGKTIASLQGEIAMRYKPQLQNTTVVLTLESSVIQVVISGAVQKPTKLVFERPTTVVQAIMEAGGVSEFGSLRRVHLIRLINGQQFTQIIDLSGVTRGETTKPYYVRDGDVIYVPQSAFLIDLLKVIYFHNGHAGGVGFPANDRSVNTRAQRSDNRGLAIIGWRNSLLRFVAPELSASCR